MRQDALTMKCQNIGSLTKKIYKQIFDSGKLNCNKRKYMSLESIAKNGSVVMCEN